MSGLCAMLPPAVAAGYVQKADGTGSYVAFAMPSSAILRCGVEVLFPSAGFKTIASHSLQVRRGLCNDNDSPSSDATGMTVDDVTAPATRDGLFDAINDGEWHDIVFLIADDVHTSNSTPFGVSDEIFFGVLFSGPSQSTAMWYRNFRADVGNTGSWTHESYLGDSNGFSQTNVTVVS